MLIAVFLVTLIHLPSSVSCSLFDKFKTEVISKEEIKDEELQDTYQKWALSYITKFVKSSGPEMTYAHLDAVKQLLIKLKDKSDGLKLPSETAYLADEFFQTKAITADNMGGLFDVDYLVPNLQKMQSMYSSKVRHEELDELHFIEGA